MLYIWDFVGTWAHQINGFWFRLWNLLISCWFLDFSKRVCTYFLRNWTQALLKEIPVICINLQNQNWHRYVFLILCIQVILFEFKINWLWPLICTGAWDYYPLLQEWPAGVQDQKAGDRPLRNVHMVFQPVPWGVCPLAQNLPVRVLSQVHEDLHDSQETHGRCNINMYTNMRMWIVKEIF